MSRTLLEIESVLQQLIVEHRKLLKHLEAHQAAMKKMAMDEMDKCGNLQEGSRLRIVALDYHRKVLIGKLIKEHKLSGNITITRLAQAFPQRGPGLLMLRDELKKIVAQIQHRSHVAGRLAGAVLGHLNTVVRLIAGAVERAGIYTKRGVPQMTNRIGVMEAIG